MNCYYSNLIEGHRTHPIEIERALASDFSSDRHERDLQFEAKAHIEVQRWIDEGGLNGRAATVDGICEIHRRFGELLPEDLLVVTNPDSGHQERMVAGELRRRDVEVGRHIAVSPGAVRRFLQRFEDTYAGLGRIETIAATAAAHHRLVWIHPFPDGNGRVARLVSYAMLRESLRTEGIWSVARGLARNVDAYKRGLAGCDELRRGELDGRGALSEAALAEFTVFFLKVCLDQVRFMESLVRPQHLRDRILRWAQEDAKRERLPAQAGRVLESVLFRGELRRGDVPSLLHTTERSRSRSSGSSARPRGR